MNYYEILNINKNASQKEIKEAYRKLSMKWHPDKHQQSNKKKDAEDMFKSISEAYTCLSNETTKRNVRK